MPIMPIFRDAKSGKLNMLGFTLFTAMVSFIVIGIGVVVIQHMINSEQNYSQIISSLLNQQEMDSTKDIIRLDALQVFNLVYRAKFFEYFDANFSQTTFNDEYSDVGLDKLDWTAYQKDFTCAMFFGGGTACDGTKFSMFVANKIIGLLYEYSGYFKGQTYWFRIYDYSLQKNPQYSVDITNPTNPTNITSQQFQSALNAGLFGANQADRFILLINCDKTNQANCPNGSFYTNIDLYNIEPKLYLDLPRVFLKRAYDDSSVDDAILPNNIISFFIPMRLYGALAFTRETLQNFKFEDYKDEWYGDEIENIGACSSFDGQDYYDLDSHKKSKSKDQLQSEIISNIMNSSLQNATGNNFILIVDGVVIEPNGEFDAKIFTLNVVGLPAITLTERKFSLLQIKTSVVDKNPFYSFGHTSTMVFRFFGVGEVQKIMQSAQQTCNCEIDPNSKLLDCS